MAKAAYLKSRFLRLTVNTAASPLNDMWVTRIDDITEIPYDDITGAQEGASPDLSRRWFPGYPTKRFVLYGWAYNQGESKFLKQNIAVPPTLTYGGLNWHAYEWVVRKTWPLEDVTGTGPDNNDTQKVWIDDIPILELNAKMFFEDNGPDQPTTIGDTSTSRGTGAVFTHTTTDFGFGTLTLPDPCWERKYSIVHDLRKNRMQGEVQLVGGADETYTIASAGADYKAFFDISGTNTTNEMQEVSITLNLPASGDDQTTIICGINQITFRANRRRGGGIQMIAVLTQNLAAA
jgi:hypothetical protein